MKVAIDGGVEVIPKEYGGLVLPLVVQLEKKLKKIRTPDGLVNLSYNPDAEMLKEFLLLRVEGLKLVKPEYYDWDTIASTAYRVEELEWGPTYENDPEWEDSVRIVKVKERSAAGKEFMREVVKPLVNSLHPILIKELGWEKLDWLYYFITVAEKTDIQLFSSGTYRTFSALKRAVEKKVGRTPWYLILPEEVDWNFYLSIRGPIPKGFNTTKYSDLIKLVYKKELTRRELEQAREYLTSHPERIKTTLEFGILPDYPTNLPARLLYRVAGSLINKKDDGRLSKDAREHFQAMDKLMREEGISYSAALAKVTNGDRP